MQQAIDEAYLKMISKKSTILTPLNVEYNHSPMKNIIHPATEISQTEFAYFSLVAILLPCLTGILIPLVEEKQDGIKVCNSKFYLLQSYFCLIYHFFLGNIKHCYNIQFHESSWVFYYKLWYLLSCCITFTPGGYHIQNI